MTYSAALTVAHIFYLAYSTHPYFSEYSGAHVLASTALTMSMLTVEECELLTDSKYRSYITQVEKALRNFEYTSEWADLISALGKLNKVLYFLVYLFL